MSNTVFLWIVLIVLPSCVYGLKKNNSMWDEVQSRKEVRWIARAIREKNLTLLFLAENITVFLPSNDAYFRFRPSMFGYPDTRETWNSLLLYSSVKGSLLHDKMHDGDVIGTRLGSDFRMYCNRYTDDRGDYLTINGARFIESDIQTENGVLHIIDTVLAPYASNKTMAEYLEQPAIPKLAFRSIILAKGVVRELANETRDRNKLFTSFSPNDSFLFPMPHYGQDKLFRDFDLLKNVYQAHVVPYSVHFLPSHGNMPPIQASHGTLTFATYRGERYVYNNFVRARIIMANIPLANGVLHVIDNLLFYIYDDVVQRLSALPETRLLSEYIERLPEAFRTDLKRTDKEFTVFAPTDWAFSKIPVSQQKELNKDDDDGLKNLQYFVEGHIIAGVTLDAAMLSRDQVLLTVDNRTINVIHLEGKTYLESGALRAQVEMTNIGCTNGIIHYISNVLFFRNFTIWEAIENIPELSIMYTFALQYADIEKNLSSESSGGLTMFIAGDTVLQSSSDTANDILKNFPHMVYQALLGQIIHGQFSSSSVVNSVQVGTLAGKSLRIYKKRINSDQEVMMVEGSHVKARVLVRDIWCSNGVLHIVNDILHVAIRSVTEELSRRRETSYTRHLLEATTLQAHLSQLSQRFTLFVPHNDAYARLPWSSVDALLKNINKTSQLLKAHIVTGERKYIDELADRQMLHADKNVIYIIKKDGHVYAVNNNLWARVIEADIPASNGVIHITDTLVYYPYQTVAERLDSNTEMRPFYELMSALPEFRDLVDNPDRNVTIFAPSAEYLHSLAASRLVKLGNSTTVLRKLFRGHVLPYFRLDDEFLRRYPDQDYVSRSALNTTFTLKRSGDETYLDAGYEPAYIDLIGRGYGCSNGVIYVIDGFLNYSPFSLIERLHDDEKIKKSLSYLLMMINYTVNELLSRDERSFTLIIPDNDALRKLSYSDFATLKNFPLSERLKVFWRHVLNDTEIMYGDLRQGKVRSDSLPPEVVLETNHDGVFFKWRHVRARVISSDRLASNGVIHIVDSFLFTTSDPETTPPTTTTSSTTVLSTVTTATAPVTVSWNFVFFVNILIVYGAT